MGTRMLCRAALTPTPLMRPESGTGSCPSDLNCAINTSAGVWYLHRHELSVCVGGGKSETYQSANVIMVLGSSTSQRDFCGSSGSVERLNDHDYTESKAGVIAYHLSEANANESIVGGVELMRRSVQITKVPRSPSMYCVERWLRG
jgi:hypothetical protein